MDNNIEKKKQLNSMMGASGENLSEDAIKAAKKGDGKALLSSLSNEDRQKLNDILKDKQALQNILKSPQAAAILKMISGGNKNG